MTKTFAFGTALKLGDGASPEVFTTVGNVSNISLSGYTVDSVDVTTHDSTNGFREYIAGMSDGGEVGFDLVFDSTATASLKTTMDAKTVKNWKVEFATSPVKTWAFTGFLTSLELEAPIDAAIAGSATIKVTGKPTLS